MGRTRLRGNQIKSDNVSSDRIKDQTITGDDIAPGSLDGDMFVDGSIGDDKLSPLVTKQGNVFNGALQLVRLDATGKLPAIDGSQLTNLPSAGTDASLLTTGTLADARLTANVTLAGNTFNGALQLVRLDATGKLPALDGSQLTNILSSQWVNSGSDIYFSAGLVGIGAAGTPGARLQVTGGASDQYAFWASNGPALGGVRVWGLASGASAGRVSIGQSSAGIGGTPDGSSSLTVFGSAFFSSNLQGGAQNVLRVQNPNSSTPTNNAEARIRFQVGSTSLGNVGVASIGGLIEDVATGSGALIFGTSLANSLAERMRLNSAGVLSIGRQSTGLAGAIIEAQGIIATISEGAISSGASARIYGPVPGSAAGFFCRTALGTEAVPLAVTAGTTLGIFNARGWEPVNGFSTTSRVSIALSAVENFTDTAQGTSISFNVTNPTTLVTSTPLTVRSASTGAARVGISQSNPQARLDVGSASLGGANISGTSPGYTLGYSNVVFAKSDANNAWGLSELAGDAVVKNTTGSVVINGATGGSLYVQDGRIGISRRTGTAAEGPYTIESAGPIAVIGDTGAGTASFFRAIDYGTSNPGLSMYAAAGTEAAPAAVTSGWAIGFIGAKGHDGTGFTAAGSRGAIFFNATENWTPTAQGTQIRFRVTPPGTTTNLFALRIDPNGELFQLSATGQDCFHSLQSGGAKQWLMASENATGNWLLRNQTDSLNPFTVLPTAPTNSLVLGATSATVGVSMAVTGWDSNPPVVSMLKLVHGTLGVQPILLKTSDSDFAVVKHRDGNVLEIGTADRVFGGTDQIYVNEGTGAIALARNASDKVGVGTSNPQQKLHIDGNAQVDGHLYMGGYPNEIRGGTGASLSDLRFNASGAITFSLLDGSQAYAVMTSNAGQTNFGIGVGVGPNSTLSVLGNVGIGTYANTDIGPSNGLIVSGDVGIGTASPSAKLHVAGTALIGGQLTLGADADAGGYKVTNAANPTLAQDLATKQYVDMVATGLTLKASVRVASTGNLTLFGQPTIDGVLVATGDRVLVKDQTSASENGIYIVGPGFGLWARSTDADNTPGSEVNHGMFTFVREGSVNGGLGFVLITNDPIVLDTTPLTFTQFSTVPTIQFSTRETPSGNVDGLNRYYELANVPTPGSDELYKNGVMQDNGSESLGSPFGAGLDLVNGSTTALTPNTVNYTPGMVITQFTGPQEALAVIDSVQPNVSVTLTAPWAGSTYSGAIYEITIANDYAIRGKTLAFLTAPTGADKLRASYRY